MKLEEMKERRKELGYSYQELSRLSGVPLGTIQKIFGGMTRSPRHRTLQALEKVLGEHGSESGERGWGAYSAACPGRSNGAGAVHETARPYGAAAGPGKKKQGEYTVADYLAWPEDQRIELIDGVIYDMAAPLVVHQIISSELFSQLDRCIRSHETDCLLLSAPVDVQLDRDARTMVQPDIIVNCRNEILTRERIFGAPDFLVEILSPSTRSKDMILKLRKYQQAGVREYWIVDPEKKQIITYRFGSDPDDFDLEMFDFTQKVPVGISEGSCEVDFAEIDRRISRYPGI